MRITIECGPVTDAQLDAVRKTLAALWGLALDEITAERMPEIPETTEVQESKVKMTAGYCHEFGGEDSSPEDMETQIYTPRGDETLIHYRFIDTNWCGVFYCPADGLYRAQTCVSLGVPNPV